MDLSVVVATLNARDRLATCLDALAAHAADAEVIVANGPSTDGTTGMIRDRDDVDVLVEIADRNVNAARNAGFRAASGDAVAFLSDEVSVEPGWRDAVVSALADGAAIVTGPVSYAAETGSDPHERVRASAGGLAVDRFASENVTLSREALDEIDGFDEYLDADGSRDAAHRAAALELDTEWTTDAAVRYEAGAVRADGFGTTDWGVKYRSLSYRLAKNVGPRPAVVGRTLRHAVEDGVHAFRDVLDGSFPPSRWLGNGRAVAANSCRGFVDGLLARYRSSADRNPNGASSRRDRAVRTYDWR